MTYDRWNVNLWYVNFVEVLYKRRLYIFYVKISGKTKYEFKSIYTCIVKKNIQDVDLRYKNFKSCFWQSTLTQTYILCFIASVSRLIFQFPMYIKKNLLFCHRTQAIVLHHMFFNNYLEFSIACGNIFITLFPKHNSATQHK